MFIISASGSGGLTSCCLLTQFLGFIKIPVENSLRFLWKASLHLIAHLPELLVFTFTIKNSILIFMIIIFKELITSNNHKKGCKILQPYEEICDYILC